MGCRIVRLNADGLANPLHGKIIPAHLVSDDAQVVQRVGMLWIRRQDLPVKRLRFRQPPRPVALKRQVECFWDRHRGDASPPLITIGLREKRGDF